MASAIYTVLLILPSGTRQTHSQFGSGSCSVTSALVFTGPGSSQRGRESLSSALLSSGSLS